MPKVAKDVDIYTPLDVMEEVQKKAQAALADAKKRAYDVTVLYNAKPKGQMRKLKQQMYDAAAEVSQLENEIENREYHLGARRKMGK